MLSRLQYSFRFGANTVIMVKKPQKPSQQSRFELMTLTEDCKLVVTCKMQNRNATDKLNQQCSKIALFANTINNANLLHCGFSLSVHFYFASDTILCTCTNEMVDLCELWSNFNGSHYWKFSSCFLDSAASGSSLTVVAHHVGQCLLPKARTSS